MENETKHRAKILISAELLLEILDFKGGELLDASVDHFQRLSILIDHPDMPEVKVGEAYGIVNTEYEQTWGNGHPVKIERILPPKKK